MTRLGVDRALSRSESCRVLVIAPHPGDETLAVGGTLHRLHERGCAIAVAAITNGEASHPYSYTHTPDTLGEMCVSEHRAALAQLGLGTFHRLGIPDGTVTAHEPELVATFARLFRGAGVCFAPYELDGHPDHEAAGRAAIEACRNEGVRLLRYPLWAFHDSDPSNARRIDLGARARAAKARAIACFRSKLEPLSPLPGDERLLPPAALARFKRPFEVVFE